MSVGRIFEWRTYRFAPGTVPAYLAQFQSGGLPFVTRHLPLLGYWMTETGRLNTLHHLWVYDDLADRTTRRAALAADPEWTQGFGPKAFPLILAQDNVLMRQVEASARLEQAIAGAMKPFAALPAEAPVAGPGWSTVEFAREPDACDTGALVGRWETISGEAPGTVVTLCNFSNPRDVTLSSGPVLRHEIIRPCGFSPL